MYELFRSALFRLEPERAHALALNALQLAHRARVLRAPVNTQSTLQCMGLQFPNRIGLAAGFDKNARYIDALAALGFGFIEVGTVTPRPQSGQPQPRLFRLPNERALINRMGFPNEGAHAVAERLKQRTFNGVLGINIGKNAATPLERAIDDYVECYRVLARHADYVAVNVSSPNTKDLRRLQHADQLRPILEALLEERNALPDERSRRAPLLAKVSPDSSDETLIEIAQLLVELRIDGVIATNTTVSKHGVYGSDEVGGLSGQPLRPLTLHAIRTLKNATRGRIAIIGVGGIAAKEDALEMLDAGADLLQLYTGLIYRGPTLVRDLVRMRQT